MSIESAKKFINRMKSDDQFAQRATECRDAEAWLALTKETGLNISIDDITVEDIQAALAELNYEERK
jgi:predicted ribosomally synthesized peptide with nif11-like leader